MVVMPLQVGLSQHHPPTRLLTNIVNLHGCRYSDYMHLSDERRLGYRSKTFPDELRIPIELQLRRVYLSAIVAVQKTNGTAKLLLLLMAMMIMII